MAGEWKSYHLDELCDFINGFAFKSTDYVLPHSDTIEVFRMGYIERGGGFKEDNSPVFVPRKYGRSLEKYFLHAGDITIAMTDMKDRMAILGNTAWIQSAGRFVINQRVGCLRVKRPDLIDSRFLYFYSNWTPHVDYLRSRANSGVQVNLSTSAIKESQLTIPPLDEQKRIAEILGALDDKIELNRKMNATLEQMARALFQSWFVDFDPVHAKAAGRQPIGMDKATTDLFPDSFVESELGKIPKGWEVRDLDKTAHYLNGLALQKYPTGDDATLPVIKIAQLRKGDSAGADRCNTNLPPNYIVQDGDVLFSWSGSLEVELWCGGPGALNQHLFKVTSDEFPKWFYYLWTLYHLDEFRLIAAAKATTMGHIQRGHLAAAKVLVPPGPLLEAMTYIMSSVIDQLIANRIQSRTLATLRDTLLPKLLSGELSVKGLNSKISA